MTKNKINSLYNVQFSIKDIFFSMPLDRCSIFLLLSIFPFILCISFLESNLNFNYYDFFLSIFFFYSNGIVLLLLYYSHETNYKFSSKYDLMNYIKIENKKERLQYFNMPSNLHYEKAIDFNPQLIRDFMNSEDPIIIKNEFFPENIVTLISNRKQLKNINIDLYNRKYLFKLFMYSSFCSCYITPTINWKNNDKNMHFIVTNIVNEPKSYFHFYQHLKDYYSNETIKEILFSFIFYHEMNHASLLQHRLDLSIDEYEALSDISSLIMLKKIYNMSKDEFEKLLNAACSFREINNIYPKTEAYYFNLDCFVLLKQINNWNETFFDNLDKTEITDFATILKVYLFQNIYDFTILNLISPFYSENDVVSCLNTYIKRKDHKKNREWHEQFSSKYNLIEHLSYKKTKENQTKYQKDVKNLGEHFLIEHHENIEDIIKEVFKNLPSKISLKDIIQYSSIYNKPFYNDIVYDGVMIFNKDGICDFFNSYGYNI